MSTSPPSSSAGGHRPSPYQQPTGQPPYPTAGTTPQSTGTGTGAPAQAGYHPAAATQAPVWQPAPHGVPGQPPGAPSGQHPGQQYGQQDQYGQYQAQYRHPSPYGHAPGAPMPASYQEHLPRPAPVWIASVLLWISCVLALAAGITAFVIRASIDLTPDPTAPPSMFDGLGVVLGGALALIGGVMIASALVLAALTFGAFRGNNPCRWVLIVLYGLAVLQMIPSAMMLGSQPMDVPGVIWLLMAVNGLTAAAICAMFLLPPTSAWYRYRSAETERKRQQAF